MDSTFNIPEGQCSPEDWLSFPFTSPPIHDAQWVEWDPMFGPTEQRRPGNPSGPMHSSSPTADGSSQNNVSNLPPELNQTSTLPPTELIWSLVSSQPVKPVIGEGELYQNSPGSDACGRRNTESPQANISESGLTSGTCTANSSPTETSASIEVTIGPPVGPVPHVSVERKYRHGMVAMFARLRDAIPALNIPGDMYADGSSARPTKAKILTSAIDYIKTMEAERDRMQDRYASKVAENERLRRAILELEGRLGIPRCGVFSVMSDS
ncbi:hypothetical protein DBV05_g6176 [Lasiodiplodia theobromae]|uniref:BHLH domain-containing protein n=1 Tax=Lasiodiplodia theobromae TaxID=45133 RepID=A0A5N5DBP6_9PEZI|nr:hypothetical protein DBV05_g6176 [Lasiodiplodia theobromae]